MAEGISDLDGCDVSAMDDKGLALRAFWLALLSIAAKQKGEPNPYVEAVFPATVREIQSRPSMRDHQG